MDHKFNFKKIIDYILIAIFLIIAIRKGGYYKVDTLLGIFLIQIVSGVYYIFNRKNIKINLVISISLLVLAISYFLPVVFNNSMTVSGALNIAVRISSIYSLYIIISNSDNKKMYFKSITIFAVIFGIIGIDELSYRNMEKIVNILGGGYLQDINRMSSVLQYANLLGILSVISFANILDFSKEECGLKCNNIKKAFKDTILLFLTVVILLTQSKMSILLLIISAIVYIVINRKIKKVLDIIAIIVLSILITSVGNIVFSVTIGTILYFIYSYIKYSIKNRYISTGIFIILLFIACMFSINYIKENNMVLVFKGYFNSFDSTTSRMVYYTDALKIWSSNTKNVMFGIGGNGFRTAYEGIQTQEYISLEIHSMILQILVESGIIGFLSILAIVIYTLIKGKNNKQKLLFLLITIYMLFDVSLTYMFFLIMFIVILANVDFENEKKIETYKLILTGTILVITFAINTSFLFAYIISPEEYRNLNCTIEEQESIIRKCEISCILDPYDLEYRDKLFSSYKTYVDMLNIKSEIYGTDYSSTKKDIILKMEESIKAELKYEKENKYVRQDVLAFYSNYLNNIATNSEDIQAKYEEILMVLEEQIWALEEKHRYNILSQEIASDYRVRVYEKYEDINKILNSEQIQKKIEGLKEKNI